MDDNKSYKSIFKSLMIDRVPHYANRLFYSLGFLSILCFASLLLTGLLMVFHGPTWWLTDPVGKFMRSIHLWSTQAFVLFTILHLVIVYFTSAFRGPRRLTWIFGALTFFFLMGESEFGYVLRGDFSSQWRSLQGADLYNGSGIGAVLNALNYQQIYGIHIVLVPIIIIALLFCHYLLVKSLGIAKPYRGDVACEIVPADHRILFLRGFVLIIAIIVLSSIFPSPFLKPTTIKEIAQKDPALLAATLAHEFDKTSDTATYSDNIDPYTFDTRAVYVETPYKQLVSPTATNDVLQLFNSESKDVQNKQVKAASDYYNGDKKTKPDLGNPVIAMITSLIPFAQSGVYEAALFPASATGGDPTYVTRFLADTGVMDEKADSLGITTEKYGMLREESGKLPPGAWWLAPVGLLDHTILANDPNQDRDGAIILGLLILLLIAVPYIPFINKLPDKLKLYKLIWRDRTK